MNTQTMKQGLRQSIIAARQKLAAADHDAFSLVITKRIMQLDAYQRAKTVLAYMSFGAEFATSAWVQQALHDGKRVLLPRVNRSSRQLELFQVADLQQDVAPGLWDIPEPLPQRCRSVEDSEQIDFILLPGVAFARDGSRLGYGGGFYDKLLERISPVVLPLPTPPPGGDLLAGSCPLRSGSAVEEGVNTAGRAQQAGQPVLVAAAFAMQLVKDIPQEATDRKVEWLITENEVIRCGTE